MQTPILQPPLFRDFELNQESPQARGLVGWWPAAWSRGASSIYNRSASYASLMSLVNGAATVLTPQGVGFLTDGSNDYGSIAKTAGLNFGTGSFSFTSWFNLLSIPADGRVVNDRGRGGGGTGGFQLKVGSQSGGWWITDTEVDGSAEVILSGGTGSVHSLNTFYFICLIWDAVTQSLAFYVDTVQDSANAGSGVGSITNTKPIVFGTSIYQSNSPDPPSQSTNMQIVDPRFYNRVLTVADMKSMYNPNTRWDLYFPIVRYFGLKNAANLYSVVVDGSITASGDLLKQPKKILTGSSTAVGTLIKTPKKLFDGSISPSGILLKTPKKLFDGSITASGALVNQPRKVLAGSITTSGTLLRNAFKNFDGSIAPSGSVLKKTYKSFAGSITPEGQNLNTTTKIFSGSITPDGTLVKMPIKVLSGSITAAGTLLRNTYKILDGSITASGELLKTTYKILSGSITPSGALSNFKIFLIELSGSITATGELLKKTYKNFTGSTTPSGDLVKKTYKILDGSITPSGALTTIKTFFVNLAGSITATGDLIKRTYKNFDGSITASGALVKQPRKILSGSITASGALLKQTYKILSGNIQATGELLRQPQKNFSGSITATGELVKQPRKILVGSITPSGALLRNTFKVLAGSVTASGTLLKSTKKVLAGLIEANGTLTTAIIGEFVMIPGQTARLQYRIQDYQNFWEAYVRRNDDDDNWDFYVDKVEAGVRTLEFFQADVGTPNAIRVICYGNTHVFYTYDGTVYTPQVTLTDSFLATETDTGVLYSSVIIPVRHRAWPRNSVEYNTLDRE